MNTIKKFIKSLYMKIVPETKETNYYCRRCGRKLKTEESRKLGLGKCCYKKELRTKYSKPLF